MCRVWTQFEKPVREICCDFAQSQSPTPRCCWVTSHTSGNVSTAERHILQTGQKVIWAWLVQIGTSLSVGNVSLNTRGGPAVRRPALLSQNTHVCPPETAAMEPRAAGCALTPWTLLLMLFPQICVQRDKGQLMRGFFCFFWLLLAART